MPRLARLDGLRGIAILLVLLWHYYACQIFTTPDSPAGIARQALSLAWTGVDLFFVLSGFLIAGILLDNREAPNYFSVFYARRACRILPLYFLVLALYAVFAASGPLASPPFQQPPQEPWSLWPYALFVQNVLMGLRDEYGPDWLAVTWSLAVEEQFYLVVPLLIWALPRRALAAALGAGILSAPLLHHLSPGFHAFVNAPWHADALLSGALLAVAVRHPPFLAAVRERRGVLQGVLLTFLLGGLLLTARPESLGPLTSFWLACMYSALLLTAYAGTESWLSRGLESPVLVWLGRLSFALYLLHQAVAGLAHGLLRQQAPQIRTLADAGVTLIALAVTLGLAALSYRWLEQPLVRFGHRFQYARIK